MSYSADIGLALFTAPFRSQQASMAAPASSRGTARPSKSPQVTAPKLQTPVSPVRQTKPPVSAGQTKNPVPEEKKIPEKPQAKISEPAPEPEQKPKPQPEPPKSELSLDMSDHSIPAGKPLEASEDAKRKAHEESEAKRKAEWESRQLAKKQAEEETVQNLQAMADADAVAAATECVRLSIERITRRNMKECVAGYIRELCQGDPAFARCVMYPKKSLANCFKYINRQAKEYLKREMEENGIEPENNGYGGDVPDGICYQWAEDYFRDPEAMEDREKEEKFIPRPYVGSPARKKAAKTKSTSKKGGKKKPETDGGYEQISLEGID